MKSCDFGCGLVEILINKLKQKLCLLNGNTANGVVRPLYNCRFSLLLRQPFCFVLFCFFSFFVLFVFFFPISLRKVEEYVKSGRDRMVIDPQPYEIYSKLKEKKRGIMNVMNSTSSSSLGVKYPRDGWRNSLERKWVCMLQIQGKRYRAPNIIPSEQIYKRQQLFWPTSQKVIESPKLMNKNTFIPARSAIMASKKARPLTSKPVMEVTISKRKLEKLSREANVCFWNYLFICSCLRWDSKCKPSHLPARFHGLHL